MVEGADTQTKRLRGWLPFKPLLDYFFNYYFKCEDNLADGEQRSYG